MPSNTVAVAMIALCFKDTAFFPRQSKNISDSERKETRIKVKIMEFYMSGVTNVSRLCPYAVLHQGRFEL